MHSSRFNADVDLKWHIGQILCNYLISEGLDLGSNLRFKEIGDGAVEKFDEFFIKTARSRQLNFQSANLDGAFYYVENEPMFKRGDVENDSERHVRHQIGRVTADVYCAVFVPPRHRSVRRHVRRNDVDGAGRNIEHFLFAERKFGQFYLGYVDVDAGETEGLVGNERRGDGFDENWIDDAPDFSDAIGLQKDLQRGFL